MTEDEQNIRDLCEAHQWRSPDERCLSNGTWEIHVFVSPDHRVRIVGAGDTKEEAYTAVCAGVAEIGGPEVFDI